VVEGICIGGVSMMAGRIKPQERKYGEAWLAPLARGRGGPGLAEKRMKKAEDWVGAKKVNSPLWILIQGRIIGGKAIDMGRRRQIGLV